MGKKAPLKLFAPLLPAAMVRGKLDIHMLALSNLFTGIVIWQEPCCQT